MSNLSAMPSAAGEVVAATTARLTAQCPPSRLHTPPPLAAFVKIVPPGTAAFSPEIVTEEPENDDPFADPTPPRSASTFFAAEGTLYALVTGATTGSLDASRRPAAYGMDEETLRREQPQIFDLLATEFSAVLVAHVVEGRLRVGLPPAPPRLHAPVWECAEQEVRLLSEQPDWVRTLVASAGDTHADEIITACLRRGWESHQRDFGYLVSAGKQLAAVLRDEPQRLAAILRRLQP